MHNAFNVRQRFQCDWRLRSLVVWCNIAISMCRVQMPTSNSLNPFSTNRRKWNKFLRKQIPMVMHNLTNIQFRSFECGHWTYDKVRYFECFIRKYTIWEHRMYGYFIQYSYRKSNIIQTSPLYWTHSHLYAFQKISLAPPRNKNHSIRKR